MIDRILLCAALLAVPATGAVLPPTPATPAAGLARFIKVPAGRIAPTHVRVIDGTGAAPRADQTILIDAGRIVSVTPSKAKPPAGATIIDMTGRTALPGLVGMHNHLFYMAKPNTSAALPRGEPVNLLPEMLFSSPRLYLANGVTTMRTTGSVEPDGDLGTKREIDAGRQPGPNIDMTAPYVEGAGSVFPQMPEITTAAGARAHVDYWATRGATSFKIYNNVTLDVLKATIDAAHARGIKVTGHLCSITHPEAIDAGIDNLEHGFYANTQLDPDKTPDTCSASRGEATLLAMTPETPEAKTLIASLVAHKVTLTSTLPVFEYGDRAFPAISAGARAALTPQAQADLAVRADAYAAAPEARRAI
ncbi:MAG: amidohydrolase family protein, partial [Sandarakinorhabdus sp.]|nr:amidohydrolase family protein [Sandarakinorhabdus sp.]